MHGVGDKKYASKKGNLGEGQVVAYTGNFNSNQRHNFGVSTLANGEVYEGCHSRDAFEGWGRYTYRDGGEYEGDWTAGQRNGTGLMRFADGGSYAGEWRVDYPHGWGVLRIGETTMYSEYSGCFEEGVKQGEGSLCMVVVDDAGVRSVTLLREGEWRNNEFVEPVV